MCPDISLKIFFWNEPNWANFINKQIKLFSIDETLSWIDYSLCYETERKERIYMSFAWGQFEIRDWFLNQLNWLKSTIIRLVFKSSWLSKRVCVLVKPRGGGKLCDSSRSQTKVLNVVCEPPGHGIDTILSACFCTLMPRLKNDRICQNVSFLAP